MPFVSGLAAGWVALLLAAPWLPVPVGAVLYLLGSRICHQIPERSFHLDGAQLPVCARCLGIYLGAAIALMSAPRRPAGVASRRLADGWMRSYAGRVARSGPAVMVLGALALNAGTLAVELSGLSPLSNAGRALAGAALGGAVGVAVAQVVGLRCARTVQ